MINNKKVGVLLPIFSLPGTVGIGDFGQSAFEFIDILKINNVDIWQLLPLNPLNDSNSPYQCLSTHAGDAIYISIEKLAKEGLITIELPQKVVTSEVKYEKVRQLKEIYLQNAFTNFVQTSDYIIFMKENPWVIDYANFVSRSKCDGYWLNWDDKDDYSIKYISEMKYECFIQYMFYKQWMEIKVEANKKGVAILGDIPMYVGLNSADVWVNKKYFMIDEDCRPMYVAGVPPDEFSDFGQCWGHPTYNWHYLEKTDFKFLVDRIRYNSNLYDVLRMDHFRAIDSYYKIDAQYSDAKIGEWCDAPGENFLVTLFRKCGDVNLVAEDLGNMNYETIELRNRFKIPGMKVIQFGFDPDNDYNEDLSNTVVYTSTHDNQTVTSWFTSQPDECRTRINNYFQNNNYHGTISEMIIKYCLKLKASMIIFPIQDIMSLDDSARINTPGSVGSPNWEFKLKTLDGIKIIID